ncbi:blue copper protein 1b-like [Alnus glutinosa]|uniref:blue copper protein 1b-like n=1 Tax=Alnus glutinosa TaxID=3517 RepID=UPI002D7A0774|nr:blue copper protein 1b-like [Alnus glutinosa]
MAFTQFFVLAIVAILVPSILAVEFMVGDDQGWTTNYDYQAWAKGKEFHVGDKLVFKYPEGAHSVIKVNGTSFQQCATSAGNGILTSGNDVIPLETLGNKWYICGVAKHCEVGNQKLSITVSEGSSSAARKSIAPMYYGWITAIFGILAMVMV